MKITAAVVPIRSAPFEIETLDLAAPLADEVLVRVVASGMCHTDLHARDGYFPNLPYPVVCGHEGADIIEEVGAAVADLAPGDPVVISFPWSGECGSCRAGRISYCERARSLKSSMPTGLRPAGRRFPHSFTSTDGFPSRHRVLVVDDIDRSLLWGHRASDLQNFGLGGTDYPIGEIADQLLLRFVTVRVQNPRIAPEVLEHAVLVASCQ